MYIDEIFDLDEILNYEEKAFLQKKISISNVSYWNPSMEYQKYMLDVNNGELGFFRKYP